MTPKKTLNIFYNLDKYFIIPFTVSLTSLLENNKDIDVTVYLIHNLEDTNLLKNISNFFQKKYSIKLHLKFFSSNVLNKLPTPKYISGAAYNRLFVADIIPEHVSSGLYIDCDTVITGSLKELIDIDSFSNNSGSEYHLLAVEDRFGFNDIERLNKLEIKPDFYFNSGVLLINLKKWRSENISEKLMLVANQFENDLKWCDQDVLNIYFIGKCGRLKETFNSITEKRLPETPTIIHFSGSSKPWHYINNGPYKSIYRKYLKLTPFKNEKFEQISAKKILRKFINAVKSRLKISSFTESFLSQSHKLTK